MENQSEEQVLNEEIPKTTKSTVSDAQRRAIKKYYEKMKDTEKYKQQCLARQKAFYEKNKRKYWNIKRNITKRKNNKLMKNIYLSFQHKFY